MKRAITFVLLISLLCVYTVPVYALSYPEIQVSGADAYVLMDLKSGKVLAEYQSKKQIYPASTTKMLTAIVALENGELDQKMTASTNAVYDIGKDGMNIGIQPGEVITLEYLLHAMLIVSANETANIIAENISETRDRFMELANEKAKEIGTESTNFTNPCGMHQSTHYTTAMDLGKIACYAMKNQIFRSIVRKTSFKMPATNKHSSWNTLYTSNILLKNNNFDGYEIMGVKSGYTDPAGRCLISSARNEEGEELLLVVMGVRGGDTGQTITDISKKLYSYGFDNFKNIKLINKNVFLGLHSIEDARGNTPLALVAQDDLEVFTLESIDTDNIECRININEDLQLPVKTSDFVGTAEFYYENELLGSVDVSAGNNVYTNYATNDKNDDRDKSKDTGNQIVDKSNDNNEVHQNPGQASEVKEKSLFSQMIKIVLYVLLAFVFTYILLALFVNIRKKLRYRKRR